MERVSGQNAPRTNAPKSSRVWTFVAAVELDHCCRKTSTMTMSLGTNWRLFLVLIFVGWLTYRHCLHSYNGAPRQNVNKIKRPVTACLSISPHVMLKESECWAHIYLQWNLTNWQRNRYIVILTVRPRMSSKKIRSSKRWSAIVVTSDFRLLDIISHITNLRHWHWISGWQKQTGRDIILVDV